MRDAEVTFAAVRSIAGVTPAVPAYRPAARLQVPLRGVWKRIRRAGREINDLVDGRDRSHPLYRYVVDLRFTIVRSQSYHAVLQPVSDAVHVCTSSA